MPTRLAILLVLLVCAACGGGPEPCMTPAAAARLEASPRFAIHAQRLAAYYRDCRHDPHRQARWLRLAAEQGDRQAMRELADQMAASHVGDPREIARWRKGSTR